MRHSAVDHRSIFILRRRLRLCCEGRVQSSCLLVLVQITMARKVRAYGCCCVMRNYSNTDQLVVYAIHKVAICMSTRSYFVSAPPMQNSYFCYVFVMQEQLILGFVLLVGLCPIYINGGKHFTLVCSEKLARIKKVVRVDHFSRPNLLRADQIWLQKLVWPTKTVCYRDGQILYHQLQLVAIPCMLYRSHLDYSHAVHFLVHYSTRDQLQLLCCNSSKWQRTIVSIANQLFIAVIICMHACSYVRTAIQLPSQLYVAARFKPSNDLN